jgi:NADH dehydrogenase [ubiquinone] 1 alpha subcomplex assembly factor 7
MPGFHEAVVLHLVEISPALQAQQERTLQAQTTPVFWHGAFEDVPKGPAIIIANEFFDALPVNQAMKSSRGWHERLIEIDPAGQLAFTIAPDPIPRFQTLLPPTLHDAPEGSVFEWRDDIVAMQLGRRIANEGGAALVIDYGHAESDIGDTLQAVGGHAYADPLTSPGNLDLTAHVDFQALARAVEAMGANAFGPLEQGDFLRRLGIETRAATLKAKASPAAASQIDAALARLTGFGRTDMGRLFKAMAFAHHSLGVPPAFD